MRRISFRADVPRTSVPEAEALPTTPPRPARKSLFGFRNLAPQVLFSPDNKESPLRGQKKLARHSFHVAATARVLPRSSPDKDKDEPKKRFSQRGLGDLLIGRFSGSASKPKSKKGLLSKKALLMKMRRDSADAAATAAHRLAVAERRFKAASGAHEALVSAHTTALRQTALALNQLALADFDSAAFEAIRDLRLFSAMPPRTALVSRCACVLLAALSWAPEVQADSGAGTAAPAASTMTNANELAGLASVQTTKAVIRLGDDVVSATLGRKDLQKLLTSCRLERLVKNPEVVSLIARTGGNFASAVEGAARAPGLAAEMSAKPAPKKKSVSAALLFKRVKIAHRLTKRATKPGGDAKGSGLTARMSSDPAAGQARRSSDPSVGGAMSAMEQQMTAEATSGKLSLEGATASTVAAGHLFKWMAKVLDAACQLCDMERAAKGPIDDAASELQAAKSDFASCKADSERLKKVESEAVNAQERHAAERRLQERARAAQITPAVSESPTGSNNDSVRSFRSEGEDEDGTSSNADTPPNERRARELVAFQEAELNRENALRRQIIADGGAFMRS